MKKEEIHAKVKEIVLQVANDKGLPISKVENHMALVDDIGLTSLEIATLVALLENEFNVDPFANGQASITDIRSVQGICQVYEKCLLGNLEQQEKAPTPLHTSRIEKRKELGKKRAH